MTERDDPIRHDPTCRAASINYFTGRHGDPMAQCRNCKRFTVLRTVADEAPAELRFAGSRHWCRAHGEPVTWRGDGCPGCNTERDEARQRRNIRRRRRAEGAGTDLDGTGRRLSRELVSGGIRSRRILDH